MDPLPVEDWMPYLKRQLYAVMPAAVVIGAFNLKQPGDIWIVIAAVVLLALLYTGIFRLCWLATRLLRSKGGKVGEFLTRRR